MSRDLFRNSFKKFESVKIDYQIPIWKEDGNSDATIKRVSLRDLFASDVIGSIIDPPNWAVNDLTVTANRQHNLDNYSVTLINGTYILSSNVNFRVNGSMFMPNVIEDNTLLKIAGFDPITGQIKYTNLSNYTGNFFNTTTDDSDDITEGAVNFFMSSGERTKLGYISVTGNINLDQIAIDVAINNAKISNVPTSLSTGTVTSTTYGITSDGSIDDVVLVEATTSTAGLLGSAKWNEIVANTAKVSNVTTNLSIANITASTLDVVSSDGTDATIPAATTLLSGLMTATKFNEVEANNAKVSNAAHTGEVTGATSLTLDPTAISNKANKATLAGTEKFLIEDSGTLKYVLASAITGYGTIGITDSTGKWTFTTAAAYDYTTTSAGQTIHLFTNVVRTSAFIIKSGVNINGNGHKMSNNTADGSYCVQLGIGGGYLGKIANVTFEKTAFAARACYVPPGGLVIIEGSNFRCYSALGKGFENASTDPNNFIRGVIGEGAEGIYHDRGLLVDSIGIGASVGYGIYAPNSGCKAINCTAKNTIGIGGQIVEAYDCTFFSVSGTAASASNLYGGSTESVSGIATDQCLLMKTRALSSSSNAAKSYSIESGSYLRSVTGIPLTSLGNNFYCKNSTIIADANICVEKTGAFSHILLGNTIETKWNNASGHAVQGGSVSLIHGNMISVTHASANLINGGSAYFKGNIDVNEVATVQFTTTQLSTRTGDSQSNI